MSRNIITVIVFFFFVVSLPGRVYAELCGRQEADDGFVWYRICDADGKQGAEDAEGRILIPTRYDEVIYYTTDGGWFSVEQNNKYGVYTTSGTMICDADYDEATYNTTKHGIWVEIKKDGGTGIIDGSGKVILRPNPKYNGGLVYTVSQGFSYKNPYNNYSYISLLIRLDEDNPEDTREPEDPNRKRHQEKDGFVWYAIKGDDGWGAEDEDGHVLIPPKYFCIVYKEDSGYFVVWVRTNDKPYQFKKALYTQSGDMILDLK